MRAKEKANELANKFITKSVFDMTDEELKEQREQGKAFAIICVDEILNDNPNVYDSDRLNHKYWKEVKREIGLLQLTCCIKCVEERNEFYTLLVDEVNFKIKEMTINEIKELVENTKELTKDEMYNVSTHLKFFDRVNYVAWVDKLLGIKLPL